MILSRPTTPPRLRTSSRLIGRPRFWLIMTAVIVMLAAVVPLLFVPRYYFLGDTQVGAFGQWYHLGSKLRAGEWPVIDLQAWHGGNYVSEGQWGLFSPLTMIIALMATVVEPVVVFVTVIKFVLITAGALGTHLLARSYRIAAPLACIAGVTVTLGGASQYLDAPEWVTSQMVWALLPWTWWALRRTMIDNANPVAALVFGLSIVSVGYVYGTIYLIIVLGACLLDATLARNLGGGLRVLLIGVCCGLFAVTVYLPGVLTASQTTRAGSTVYSEGRLQGDVPGLLSSMIPTVLSPSSPTPPSPRYPAHYISWLWPLVVWLDPRRVRTAVRPAAGLMLVVIAALLWVVGPNQVGPLRWPIRVMPFLTLGVVLLLALLVDRALLRRPSVRRLIISLALTGFAGWLIIARFWDQGPMTTTSVLAVMIGTVAVWWWWRTGHRTSTVVVVIGWSLVLLVLQHAFYPWPTAVDRRMPATLAGYRTQAAAAVGDVIIVGNPEATVLPQPDAARDFLIASSWYVSPHPVQNVYSTIGFTAFNDRYRMRFDGATYPDLADTLLGTEPRTGRSRADLLSVSTLYFTRQEQADSYVLNPPAGWRVAASTPYAVTWVRENPLPSAGGVVWSSPDLRVRVLEQSTREVRMQVDSVPSDGGSIALSRLNWPGYHVLGAGRLGESVDGYLTTIDVTEPGTVVLRYDPPGWPIERVTLALGLGLAGLWSLAVTISRWRRGSVRRRS